MDSLWRIALWQQFGATIDMLENALLACPSTHWHGRLWSDHSDHPLPPEFAAFWYITYHTLFWLNLYLTGSLEGFAPPRPLPWLSLTRAGVLPERPYTRDELHAYLVAFAQEVPDNDCRVVGRESAPTGRFPLDQGKANELFRTPLVQHAPRAGTCGPVEHVSRTERH